MKKLYIVLIVSLITSSLSAQTFTEILGTPFSGYTGPVAFADIDNDNDQDVLIGDWTFINNGNGLFENEANVDFYTEVLSIAFADIDNDNDQDLIISGEAYFFWNTIPLTGLYINDGSGNFSSIENSPFGFGYTVVTAFADVDNDNDQDLLISGNEWDPITKLYTNDGSGNFTASTGTPFEAVYGGSIAFADIDHDNDQDVLITGMSDSLAETAILYTNDGYGDFTEITETPFEGVSGGSIAFASIFNDNNQDVLIIGHNGSEPLTRLYANDGFGQFKLVTDTPFQGISNGSVAFADIDNDNDQDVLISGHIGSESITKLYNNHGNGQFTMVPNTPFDGLNNSSIAFADIDNDSDQDVLITGTDDSYQYIAKLYANNTISTLANAYDNDDQYNLITEGPASNPGSTKLNAYHTQSTGDPDLNLLFNKIIIYPNPNQGMLNIDLGDLEDVSIKVFDLNGRLIYHNDNITDHTMKFELKGIAGIYILELRAQNQQQHYKLIKQ